MKCEEVRENISLYKDQMLSEEKMKKIDKHLDNCKTCMQEYKILKDILSEISSLENKELPNSFHDNLMKKIEKGGIKKEKRKLTFVKFTKIVSPLMVASILIAVWYSGIGLNDVEPKKVFDEKKPVNRMLKAVPESQVSKVDSAKNIKMQTTSLSLETKDEDNLKAISNDTKKAEKTLLVVNNEEKNVSEKDINGYLYGFLIGILTLILVFKKIKRRDKNEK